MTRHLSGASALMVVLGVTSGVAQAQRAESALYAESEIITVTATRTREDVFSVPSTVTVIGSEEIEANLVNDIKDLIRFEPGVSVPSSPSRFGAALASTGRDGNSGFSIRGLGGNRVLFQVDGVRVPDGFSFGPASFGRGDYVDLDLLQSVEIVRGPASSLYGSDGLAGVVSFITKDPRDFLETDETFAARVRAGYASADESWAEGVSAAGQWGPWSMIASYTRRDGREQGNQGENDALNATRTTPNPQDIESNAAMARLVFQPSDAHRFRLTADYGDRSIVTEAYSGRSVPPLGSTSVIDLDGVDESERRRLAFDYVYEGETGLLDRAFMAVYYQDSSVSQFSDEDRNTAADRTRLTSFDNSAQGASAQFESAFATGAAQHRIIYGGDYSLTRQEGLRNGTVPPVGETFPARPFPNTDSELAGAFLQDEISFMDGRVVFFPSLRYDWYSLEPEDDALYTAAVASQSDAQVTPRFGVVAWPAETLGVFFNYAQGFKAPTPSQVNNNFSNPLFGYASIPNPDLTPETSESAEIGVRLRDRSFAGADVRASATAFGAWYDDFIEQAVVGGSGTIIDPILFQYINIGEVEIWGLEGRADATWSNGFGVTIAASFAEGDEINGSGRAPLESIDPLKLVAGLSYNNPGHDWGGQFIVTQVWRKEEGRTASTSFRPDAFTLVDLTGYWNLTESATMRIGVFNATDESYWWWSDVRGLSSSSVVRDAWSQPGRNVSASIAYRF
jgi:hemoglobin/transferrin/lactoferrin receptor protein